jgi:hypothetical protein
MLWWMWNTRVRFYCTVVAQGERDIGQQLLLEREMIFKVIGMQ